MPFYFGPARFFLFFFKVVFQGLFWIVLGKISGLFFGENFGDFLLQCGAVFARSFFLFSSVL